MVSVCVAFAQPFSRPERVSPQKILNRHSLLAFQLDLSQKDETISRRNRQAFLRYFADPARNLIDR
jgi:hypothetical protein